ncbi:hypothetical protein KP509_21G022100 [Ceratopteris richardii]|uniref:Uncharacterized protein n=1 Tax=Ceratopteris richardii TaxID=49495 RepID=A0A8T2S9D3_CERRI|nr:hypothetical protein KP509_21G022100 [Ceratopteris richardii]
MQRHQPQHPTQKTPSGTLPDYARFFATDEDLNVTVVACEFVNPALHPLGLDAAKVDARALTMGAKIYVLGHDRNQDSCIKLSVGSAYVISDDDKPLAIRSTGEAWLRGSAGFDHKGNFVLMVTDSEPEDNAYWRNSCVSIRRIKRWLEPQWQSTRSTSSLVVPNRGHDTHLYTRRATYAGRETNCCVDEDFTQGSDQGMRREDASKTTEIYGQHDSENVHGGEAISGNPECAQMKGDGEKLAGKRDDGQRGVRGPIATKSARPSGFGKDVEVTRAPLRGASGVGNGDGARRTGKKVPGRSASMGSLPKGNATTPNKGKGGFGNKGQALETTISSSKGKSKTSAQQQQAPQREQSKSLQLRLHDIPIKDKP